MDKKALFVGLEADASKEEEIASFLREALRPVEDEPDTRDWYAIRFAPTQFAIFDTFAGNLGRLKHLLGQVGRSLIAKSFTDLEGLPEIRTADVLIEKPLAAGGVATLCLLVLLKPRADRREDGAVFLTESLNHVRAEPGTLAWYAIRLGRDEFAIITFFADEAGREAHLAGRAAAALTERADDLLVSPPQIFRGEVLASKAGVRPTLLAEQV